MKGQDMTHPTDSELEAMAARLIHSFDTLSEADGAMEKPPPCCSRVGGGFA